MAAKRLLEDGQKEGQMGTARWHSLALLTCAWVLWGSSALYPKKAEPVKETGPLAASETLAECLSAREKIVKDMKKKWANKAEWSDLEYLGIKSGAVGMKSLDPLYTATFICLPAGTDPRPRYKE